MIYQSEEVQFVRLLMQRAHAANVEWQGGQDWLTASFEGFEISVSVRPNLSGPDLIVKSSEGDVFYRMAEATLLDPADGGYEAGHSIEPDPGAVTVAAEMLERGARRKWSPRKERFNWLPMRLFGSSQELIPIDGSPLN